MVVILGSTQTYATEYLSPRTLGMGGAGRGAPLLNDAIYLNPSYASFTPVYSVSGDYTWFEGQRNYNLSVQDARTELFQAGVGFTRREQNGAINIGASRTVVRQLGVGIGSKILIDDGSSKMTTDMMFSTSFIASQEMYASLIIDNILNSEEGRKRNLIRTIYLGFKFIPTKEIQIFLDPLYSPDYADGKKSGYSVGFEIGILADFFLRAGKFVNAEVPYMNTRGDGFGYGIGWIGPKINFDWAMHRVTSNHAGKPFTTAQSFAMTIFI
jgi:hypothetical protein